MTRQPHALPWPVRSAPAGPPAEPPAGPPAEPPAGPAGRRDLPTVLVSMPFMHADRPSIQLGLLRATAAAHGFDVRTLHANLDFAARVGPDLYRLLAQHRGRMLGDWLFSVAAFGDAAPDRDGRLPLDFADDLRHLGDTPQRVRRRLLDLRDHDVPAYLDDLLDDEDWAAARVVGFTTTFQQTAASVALARLLKQRHPHLVTVFGGANLDGEMGLELVRSVDAIDLAVIGEGDRAFPRLLGALADGTDPAAVPGVARRVGPDVVAAPAEPPYDDLDASPVPDYDEYFDRAERLGLLTAAGRHRMWLPLESARGCWWGAKHHCTFCGLNAMSMTFRAKSAGRVFDELAALTRRYGTFRFQTVDNIMDMAHLTRLLPELIAADTGYQLFYEVKSNLTRAQLRTMAQAGVSHIQPGLESLSSPVLRLMRKGVRAAQNVNLLRWARYYGIDVAWNILWGFPGETEADYREQTAAIPHLVHLQPPGNTIRIWMERFSPLFTDADPARISGRRPEPSYRYVYPEGVDLDRLAYFFEYETPGALPEQVHADLRKATGEWRDAWRGTGDPPTLTYRWAPGFLQIHDDRVEGRTDTYTFAGELAEIYRACGDRPRTAAAVRDVTGVDLPVTLITEAFAEFQQRGLMFLDDDLAVSLALPTTSGR